VILVEPDRAKNGIKLAILTQDAEGDIVMAIIISGNK
jgi:hypothetical protein